jgi:hypothetical protein
MSWDTLWHYIAIPGFSIGVYHAVKSLIKKSNVKVIYKPVSKEHSWQSGGETGVYWEHEHTFTIINNSGLPLQFKQIELTNQLPAAYVLVSIKGGKLLFGDNLLRYENSHEPWCSIRDDFHEICDSRSLVENGGHIVVRIEDEGQSGPSLGRLVLSRYHGTDSLLDRFLRSDLALRISQLINQPFLGDVIAELLVTRTNTENTANDGNPAEHNNIAERAA